MRVLRFLWDNLLSPEGWRDLWYEMRDDWNDRVGRRAMIAGGLLGAVIAIIQLIWFQ